MRLSCTEYSPPCTMKKRFILLPYKLPGTFNSKITLARVVSFQECSMECYTVCSMCTYSPVTKECRKESWQSGTLHQFPRGYLCKGKESPDLKWSLPCHHRLAVPPSFFASCSKKHAYCLFGVEWPHRER